MDKKGFDPKESLFNLTKLIIRTMTENELSVVLKEACDHILRDRLLSYTERIFDQIAFEYHDGKIKWLEFFGFNLTEHDRKLRNVIVDIFKSVCYANGIIFFSSDTN